MGDPPLTQVDDVESHVDYFGLWTHTVSGIDEDTGTTLTSTVPLGVIDGERQLHPWFVLLTFWGYRNLGLTYNRRRRVSPGRQ